MRFLGPTVGDNSPPTMILLPQNLTPDQQRQRAGALFRQPNRLSLLLWASNLGSLGDVRILIEREQSFKEWQDVA